jgi:Na+-transporting NADH:ubiquinone oxidoreductase subunit NqrB
LDSDAAVIITGVILILLGVVFTPVYQPFGNAAFWLGVLLLAIGIFVFVVRCIRP